MRATSSFLHNYRVDGTPPARVEWVLAVGRTFLTVAGLAAIYTDPTEPQRLATITYGVLSTYAIYSVIVLAWVHNTDRIRPSHGVALHGMDVLWASILTFISEGPVSPFFLFFLFVVAASAFRWGFRETIATVATTITIFLIESAIATRGPWNHSLFGDIELELNRAVLRIAYLLLTGFLLAYLAEQEKRSRAELAAIADLSRQPRLDLGVSGSITAVAAGLMRSFDAAAIVVLVREQGAHARLWQMVRTPDHPVPHLTEHEELNDVDAAGWWFDAPAATWHATLSSTDLQFRVAEPEVWRLRRKPGVLPPVVLACQPATTVMATTIGLHSEWSGRIFLFDAASGDSVPRAVHFLNSVADYITPALTSVILHRRLRSQELAAERARVARELHDGAIQTIIGMDMKLEGLRRARHLNDDVDGEVQGVQSVLRGEVFALRELMHALRPIELDVNEQFCDVLATVVERFRRDSGISARFIHNGPSPLFRPDAALEVVRIVQEALVNVRKHSRASNVAVRLTQEHGRYRVVIEDDGRGFDFDGMLTAAELDARRIGPAIIKERARVLGADLCVHSETGLGARLELTLTAQNHLPS